MLFTKHDVHAFNEIYQKKRQIILDMNTKGSRKKGGGGEGLATKKKNFFSKLSKKCGH